MKRSAYRDQDYAFGQKMLTLRVGIGLTQAQLAGELGISRQSIVDWESGRKYPKFEHLRAFIVLGIKHNIFPADREADDIREFWRSAHQRVLLDETWLADLLAAEHNKGVRRASIAASQPRVDWGDAIEVPAFYGREEELALLSRWILKERCRVIVVLGIGGVGKSALAVTFMQQMAAQFEAVIWRSLRDVPSCDTLVESCLKVLAPPVLRDTTDTPEKRLRLLMGSLRENRVLLILDNLETILEEGSPPGRMRDVAEGYTRLLRQMSETSHQSCLLFTSREKPFDLPPMEGQHSPIRVLWLAGLDGDAGTQLLAARDVVGSAHDQARLVESYQGNPLALKIATQTITDLFRGEIAPFLEHGEIVFGQVRELLREQFDRLSAIEQDVCYWLAILREPTSMSDLLKVCLSPRVSTQMLEAFDALSRRSLIERGQQAGTFSLQSVVLEYVTSRLLAEIIIEIEHGTPSRLIEYGLYLAQAKDYVRDIQEQLLVTPILALLQNMYRLQTELESRLLELLDDLRTFPQKAQGYGPANLITLLRFSRGDLRGLNFERLSLRSVFLQDVEMQDANLSAATLQDCVFTGDFDAISSVTISATGKYWAAGNRRGEVWIWEDTGRTLRAVWKAHSANIYTLRFSPDEHTLVSGSFDCSVKLWDVTSGNLLWTGWHQGGLVCSTFAPDGQFIASGGNDATVRVWDVHTGENVLTLSSQGGTVYSIDWSPDGAAIAAGCYDGNIRIWEPESKDPEAFVRVLKGHAHWVTGLSFAPDGQRFVSGSVDGTIKLWSVNEPNCIETFSEQMDQVMRVAWSPDGKTVASSDIGKMVWVWNVDNGEVQSYLHGHSAAVLALAFTPDSRTLISGSNDGTIRVWDVERGQSIRVMGGHTAFLYALEWSPDSTQIACGGANNSIALWNSDGSKSPVILHGHDWIIQGLAWSPDGRQLASGGYDSIRIWDTVTRKCIAILRDTDGADTIFLDVSWSPDGHFLACGSYPHGVQVWDMTRHTYRWLGGTSPTHIRHVSWSPDGTRLAGAGDDGRVYVWNIDNSQEPRRLIGHSRAVNSIAWHPDGVKLASSASNWDGGEVFVWNTDNEEQVQSLIGYQGIPFAAAWSPDSESVIIGGSDGMLRWWGISSRQFLHVQQAHEGAVQALKINPDGSKLASCGDDGAVIVWDLLSRMQLQKLQHERPYERLNIMGIRGLTDGEKGALRQLGAIETE